MYIYYIYTYDRDIARIALRHQTWLAGKSTFDCLVRS